MVNIHHCRMGSTIRCDSQEISNSTHQVGHEGKSMYPPVGWAPSPSICLTVSWLLYTLKWPYVCKIMTNLQKLGYPIFSQIQVGKTALAPPLRAGKLIFVGSLSVIKAAQALVVTNTIWIVFVWVKFSPTKIQ